MTVPVTSTLPLEKHIHRPCPEVEHVSSLPNHTPVDTTSYRSLRVWVSEWCEEIYWDRKRLTVWNCLVPWERVTCPGQTILVEGETWEKTPGTDQRRRTSGQSLRVTPRRTTDDGIQKMMVWSGLTTILGRLHMVGYGWVRGCRRRVTSDRRPKGLCVGAGVVDRPWTYTLVNSGGTGLVTCTHAHVSGDGGGLLHETGHRR